MSPVIEGYNARMRGASPLSNPYAYICAPIQKQNGWDAGYSQADYEIKRNQANHGIATGTKHR